MYINSKLSVPSTYTVRYAAWMGVYERRTQQVTEEDVKIAREARLKRFEGKKPAYADMLREATGGWAPEGNGASGIGDVQRVGLGESNVPEGLRHRGARDS